MQHSTALHQWPSCFQLKSFQKKIDKMEGLRRRKAHALSTLTIFEACTEHAFKIDQNCRKLFLLQFVINYCVFLLHQLKYTD